MSFLSQLFGSSQIPGIDPGQAQSRLGQKPRPFLLDVRQPEEYRSGHITGATLIPLGELSNRIHQLPKDREIICVCQSGSRSSSAVRQLKAAGFDAVNLQGGMISWSRAGLPVKKGSAR